MGAARKSVAAGAVPPLDRRSIENAPQQGQQMSKLQSSTSPAGRKTNQPARERMRIIEKVKSTSSLSLAGAKATVDDWTPTQSPPLQDLRLGKTTRYSQGSSRSIDLKFQDLQKERLERILTERPSKK